VFRLDHVVIAVRDLDDAVQRYRDLGFDVSPGGRHAVLGTQNALVRFGADFLELLTVVDEAQAKTRGPFGEALVDFLCEHVGGLVGYCVATTDIAQAAERFRTTGLQAVGPFAMERVRPDGGVVSWRLLIPHGLPWRRPWPFLIQWDASDHERLSLERPGDHANGALRIVRVAVAVRDDRSGTRLYEGQLGCDLVGRGVMAELGARRATYRLGESVVDVVAPTGDGLVRQGLDEMGEGPLEVVVTVGRLDLARGALSRAGLRWHAPPDEPHVIRPSPEDCLGVRLAFVEE